MGSERRRRGRRGLHLEGLAREVRIVGQEERARDGHAAGGGDARVLELGDELAHLPELIGAEQHCLVRLQRREADRRVGDGRDEVAQPAGLGVGRGVHAGGERVRGEGLPQLRERRDKVVEAQQLNRLHEWR